MLRQLITYSLVIFGGLTIQGQNSSLGFSTFYGSAFPIDKKDLNLGYGPHIETLDVMYEFEFDSLMVSNRPIDKGFPDVGYQSAWGALIFSELTIKEKAYYYFHLGSDDGSILWIDGEQVIDNDGIHKMTIKTDTLLLEPGKYPVKLWYFNAYPTHLGLEFKYGFADTYPRSIKKSIKPKVTKRIDFENTILFDFDDSKIRKDVVYKIDSISQELKELQNHQIKILGHTDNLGSNEYNLSLSEARAESIKARILQNCPCESLTFITSAQGELSPRADNEIEAGRQLNRRAEIFITPLPE